MKNCIYCNSTNIQSDIMVDQNTAEPGKIGLKYHTQFLVMGVEPLYAELCKDCGSITRIYLKEVNRNWCIKK
jgi:hypothetical protein